MYHSITFYPFTLSGSYNTWDNWFLIPTKRPHVGPPEMEYPFQTELPRSKLDLNNTNKNKGIFKSRSASWEFALENGHGNWAYIYRNIMGAIHGRTGKFVLEDDPEHYYIGRFEVKEWNSGDNYSTITIDALCDPYTYLTGEEEYQEYVSENIGNIRRTINLSSGFEIGDYTNLLLAIREDRSYARIYGLFTDPYDLVTDRSSTYIQINDVHAGCSYEINGISKEIIERNDTTGSRLYYSNHVSHMDSFPTIISGANTVAVTASPRFSSTDKASLTFYYKKRRL